VFTVCVGASGEFGLFVGAQHGQQRTQGQSGEAITTAQAKGVAGWCATKDPDNKVLSAINQPVLIVSGSNDTMLPDSNAYFMFKHLKNAQLILYPDAGHGAMFQYPGTLRQTHNNSLSWRNSSV
jgi:pimeloyl-ACP methyl ester carboxylesterase